jgi:hypothetical protein
MPAQGKDENARRQTDARRTADGDGTKRRMPIKRRKKWKEK